MPAGAIEHYHLGPNLELSKNLVQAIVGRIDAKGTGRFYDRYIAKEPLIYPEEFKNKLDETPPLKFAFETLTPGRQRAYIFYFSQPKQSTTRTARVEKYVQHILDGKGLND